MWKLVTPKWELQCMHVITTSADSVIQVYHCILHFSGSYTYHPDSVWSEEGRQILDAKTWSELSVLVLWPLLHLRMVLSFCRMFIFESFTSRYKRRLLTLRMSTVIVNRLCHQCRARSRCTSVLPG